MQIFNIFKFVFFVLKQVRVFGLFYMLVPKDYNNVFLFIGWTALGTFIEFCLVGSWRLMSKRFNCDLQKGYNCELLFGMYNLFICQCLIPLDSWHFCEYAILWMYIITKNLTFSCYVIFSKFHTFSDEKLYIC